ncbi:uncharacterized protein [Ptychodera flava]|uniref:uncharacterized protein n=1 Tax=Ptychodera flava TaxID=63121 RepID=UPI00396A89F5
MSIPNKPSSAPSRFITSKSTVTKDIKEWANSGNEDGSTLIIGAQLKDNITEQRMLEAKLYDLSKERYKFIVQVQLQRKAFIDRQQRKTSVMKDLLRCVDISVRNKSTKLGDKVQAYRDLIDEHYPPKRRFRQRRSESDEDEQQRAPSSNLELSFSRQGGLPLYKTEPRPSPSLKNPSPQPTPEKRMTLPAIETKGNHNLIRPTSPRHMKYRAVHDDRFVRLETTLSPLYRPGLSAEVKNYLNQLFPKDNNEVEVAE